MTDSEAGFRAFDFAGCEAWQQHWRNLEMPNTITPDQAAAAELKCRAKWYKRHVDAAYEIPAPEEPAAPRSTAPPAGPGPSAKPAPQQPPPPRSHAALPPFAGNGTLCAMQAMLLAIAVLVMLPLIRIQGLHKYFYFTALLTQMYKIYVSCPINLDRARSEVMQGRFDTLRAWAERVASQHVSHVHYAALALMMSSSPRPMLTAMGPLVVLAVYGVADCAAVRLAGRSLWATRGAPLYDRLVAARTRALSINAAMEVATAFLLLVQLLSPAARNFLQLFVYVNWVKMRYHDPAAQVYHRAVWAQVGSHAAPLFRAAPMLERGLDYVKAWFLKPPGS